MVLAGRGGFGNYSPNLGPKSPALEPQAEAPAPVQTFTSPDQAVHTGRGGYGNSVPISQIQTVTPTEYLAELQRAVDAKPPTYSVGRGGSGNITSNLKATTESQTHPEHKSPHIKPTDSH